MADRSIHYEAAFEAMLRERGVPYVAVDEAKRALFADAKLKSFDFFVHSKGGPNLLVDVKGRKLLAKPGGAAGSPQTWAPGQDVEDLRQWEQVFGDGARAVLAFVYWIDPPLLPDGSAFCHKAAGGERWYRMVGVGLADYRDHMRRRSPKWQTVALPAADFRALARPIAEWL